MTVKAADWPERRPVAETAGALIGAAGLPVSEATRLLSRASGLAREALVARPERAVDSHAATVFRELAAMRREGVPLAYLVGEREFYGRPFHVSPDVLIPRPETELLVDLALDSLRSMMATGRTSPRVLDLGTGSGAIAVTLALECSACDVVATDLAHRALVVAQRNANRLGARLVTIQSDWYRAGRPAPALDAPFDLIVSNPPYVAADDPHLRRGDLRHEPSHALTDGRDGLSAHRAIVDGAMRALTAGGHVWLEHGHLQGRAVRTMLARAGFDDIVTHADLAGLERVTGAVRRDAEWQDDGDDDLR